MINIYTPSKYCLFDLHCHFLSVYLGINLKFHNSVQEKIGTLNAVLQNNNSKRTYRRAETALMNPMTPRRTLVRTGLPNNTRTLWFVSPVATAAGWIELCT